MGSEMCIRDSSGPYGWPAGADNNHGDIRYCGTISDTALWTSTSLGEGNPIVTVVEATGVGTTGVQTTTAFNLNGSGTAVMMIASSEIGDIPNTVLMGGASNSANAAFTPLQEAVCESPTIRAQLLITNGTSSEVCGNWAIPNPPRQVLGTLLQVLIRLLQ